jgi:hypothetical protein
MLVRADLPLDTIALAVCIMDSLSSRFPLNWRLVCPLAHHEASTGHAKRHTIPASPVAESQLRNQLHIDSVNPEVIILASLMIAVKFLEDCHEPTRYYRSAWGKNMWTCHQINVTERCVMESLGYRILPLWDSRLIADALGDMQRAGRQAVVPLHHYDNDDDDRHKRSMSSGQAVFGLGLQLTPVETPLSFRTAFANMPSSATYEALHLPPRGKRKLQLNCGY